MFSSSVGRKVGGRHGRREGLSRCFWGHGYENSSGTCPGHRPRQASTTSPQSGNNFSTTLLTGKSEPLRTQMLLPPLVPSSHLTPTSAVADHVFPHLHCREWLASPFCYKGLLPHPPPGAWTHPAHTRHQQLTPAPERELLLAQQLQTSSGLAKPANFSAIQGPEPTFSNRV